MAIENIEDIAIVKALRQLDEEMTKRKLPPLELNVVGGFALMLHKVRENKDDITDVDYVGPALSDTVKDIADRIGMKTGFGTDWINSDVLMTDSTMEDFEFSTGKLHFSTVLEMNNIRVNVLDKQDLLRMKVIAIDTNVVAVGDGGADFTRFKDFNDIKLLMADMKMDMSDLEILTYAYVDEPKTYTLIEEYIEKGSAYTLDSIDQLKNGTYKDKYEGQYQEATVYKNAWGNFSFAMYGDSISRELLISPAEPRIEKAKETLAQSGYVCEETVHWAQDYLKSRGFDTSHIADFFEAAVKEELEGYWENGKPYGSITEKAYELTKEPPREREKQKTKIDNDLER